jgi:hypothetical protein
LSSSAIAAGIIIATTAAITIRILFSFARPGLNAQPAPDLPLGAGGARRRATEGFQATSAPRNEQASTAIPSQTWRSLDVWFDFETGEFKNVDYTPGQTGR